MINMEPAAIKALIDDGLPGAEVQIFSEDNTHYAALVVVDSFAGKRPIARHQMVYKCLGALMGNEIHAMSIRAYTPEEWADLQTEVAD
jgi:acid stress-induced BolA-like protein IbaG/YrbA